MPRRNRPSRARSGKGKAPAPESRPLAGGFFGTRVEPGPGRLADEDFNVRDIMSSHAKKWYRCPGCDQEIPPGVAHVVAWPVEYGGGADDRRHWHRNCWSKRAHRGAKRGR